MVRNLAGFNGAVIAMLVGYAAFLTLPLAEIIPLVLTAVLASIPVALPATFTLASAFGARALVKLGVLPTRLSAVDEAATMDVLCTASIADIAIAWTLAVGGIGMTPLPISTVASTLAAAVALALILGVVKVPVFARLKIA